MNTVKEIAADIVRELTENPEAWTKDALARDKRATPRHATDPRACSWCASGHVEKRTDSLVLHGATLQAVAHQTGLRSYGVFEPVEIVVEWNDMKARTVEQVIELFRAVAEGLAPPALLGADSPTEA